MVRWVLASFVLGILGAALINSITLGWVCFGLGLLLLLLKDRRQIALCLLFLAAGMLLTGFRLERLYAPDYGSENTYILKSLRLVQAGDDYFAWQGKVIEPENLAGAVVLILSDQYRPGVYSLQGHLYPPVQYRNPGQGWHYIRRLYAGEIGVLNRPQIRSFKERPLSLIEKARSSYRSNIVANLANADSAALALALTTGDRSLLQGELKSSVYLTGVGHIMAMSGLHVGILLGLSMAVLRRLGLGRVLGLAGFVCILVFLLFAGPSPSLVRAVLMSAWGMAALLLGREKQGMQALEWTSFFMLLYNPLWLFDYAFVFSLLATFVCLAATESLERFLAFLPEPIRRTGSISIIIQLVALPLTIYLFGSSSLWAPLANLVLIPLMPALAGFSLLSGLIPGAAGQIVSLPAKYLLGGAAEFLSLLNQFPLPIKMGGLGLVLTAVASGGIILYLCGLSLRKTLYLSVASMLITVLVFHFFLYGVVTVWFLDVGQGDSILIRSRGQWVLVDCGDARAGEKAVLPVLRFLGVDRLKALILSHSHQDHIGGMVPVLENIPVDQVYSSFLPEVPVAASTVFKQAKIYADIEVLSHNLSLSNLNDTSLQVSVGGNKLLLTGDIEREGERLYWHRIGPHRVLKVAHHGSNSSSSPEFLDKVKPQAAVISCGLNNRFGFPDKATLDNLAQAGSQVFRTDLSGYVRVDFWPWGTVSIITFLGR